MTKKGKGTPKAKPVSETVEGIEQFDGHDIKIENATVVHAFQLGRDAGIISVGEYNGKKSLDLRRFYLDDADEWRPTSKGIKIPADRVSTVLDALADKREAIFALFE